MTSADLAAWLLTYAIHSTLLLGIVWLVTSRGLVRSHFVQDVFWKAALVGGLVTATAQTVGGPAWATPLRLASSAVATPGETAAEQPMPMEMPGLTSDASPSVATAAEAAADVGSEPAASPPADTEKPASRAPVSLATLLLGAWAAIALVALAGLGIAHARLSRRLGRRESLGPSALRSLLESLCEAAGIRRPIRLTRSEGLASPVALGRSEICVPSAVITDLDAPQQCSVLAHELAHLTRNDPLWLTAACVLERVFFFQPLNRVARRRMQDAAEYLCDDWAVRRTGSGLTMAKSLMKVAEWMQGAPSPVALSGMAENPSQLLARVRRLVEHRSAAPPRLIWPTAGACALLALTAAAVPGVAASVSEIQDPVTPKVTVRPPRPSPSPMVYAEPMPYPTAGMDAKTRRLAKAALADIDVSAVTEAALAQVDIGGAVKVALDGHDGNSSAEPSDTIGVEALIQALRDSDVGVRRAAAHSLGNLESKRAVPALIAVLGDGDEEVRKNAAWSLGEIEDQRAASPLAALLRDESADVRKTAAWAIGELNLETAPAELIRAMRDANPEVRKTAVWAVSEIGDARAVPDLRALIEDPSPEVRRQAVHALGEIRDAAALQALVAAMESRDADIRRAAAAALGER